jgi:hypothetical protein
VASCAVATIEESRRNYGSLQAAQTEADKREHREQSYSVKNAGTGVATARNMVSKHINSQLENMTIG